MRYCTNKKRPNGRCVYSGAPYAWKLEAVYARNHPNRPDNTGIRDFGIIAKGGLILAYCPAFLCLIPQQGLEPGLRYRLMDKNKAKSLQKHHRSSAPVFEKNITLS